MLQKERYDEVIKRWNENFEKEISSSELIGGLVNKYEHLTKTAHGSYYDSIEGKTISTEDWEELPPTPYVHEEKLYTDLRNMCKAGMLKRRKKKGKSWYKLSNEHRLSPLKLWHKDAIMNNPADNICSIGDITFYLAGLKYTDFSDEDVTDLNGQVDSIEKHFFKTEKIFKRAGERKANLIWMDFLNKKKLHPVTKFIQWGSLINHEIQLHTAGRFFTDIRKSRLKELKGEIDRFYKRDPSGTKKRDFTGFNEKINRGAEKIDKRFQDEIKNGAIWKWNEIFMIVFSSAMNRYLANTYPHFDKTDNIVSAEQKKTRKQFDKIIDTIDDTILNSKLYISVIRPFLPISEDLQDGYNLEQVDADDVIRAERYARTDHQLASRRKDILRQKFEGRFKYRAGSSEVKNKDVDFLKEQPSIFFRENNFLEGFEKEIGLLQYDKGKLYEELDKWGNVFYMPKLPT
jgi:hypothetical protein